eukprot:1010299-Pyramimonas_sp.AAC.1
MMRCALLRRLDRHRELVEQDGLGAKAGSSPARGGAGRRPQPQDRLARQEPGRIPHGHARDGHREAQRVPEHTHIY